MGLAYVWHRDRTPVTTEHLHTGSYAVNVGGGVHAATVGLKAPFDPTNDRIRS